MSTEEKEASFKLNVDFSDLHRCVEQMGAVELDEEFSVKLEKEEKQPSEEPPESNDEMRP